MNSSFPLLHLPTNVLSHVVKYMELDSLFGLSLVSTKAKNLVKTLNTHSSHFSVVISKRISFHVSDVTRKNSLVCYFYTELGEYQENETPRRLEKPPYIDFTFLSGRDIQKWENKDYEMKDLINHLQELFHFNGIELDFNNHAQRFDIESVYRTFENVKLLTLLSSQSHDFNNQVLKKFELVKELSITDGVFENRKIPERLLIQYYDSLSISAVNLEIRLNDLLSANSKELSLYEVDFSNETINKFLKCWMKGSNSRLEYINLFASPDFIYNKDAILKGLKYGTIPNEERKRFKLSFSKYIKIIQGGFSIRRNDGTAATIVVEHDGDGYNFDMYVWHDYCIA